MRSPSALLLVLVLLASPSLASWRERPWASWMTREGADHPLVGKVWSAAEGGFVSPEALAAAMAEPPFALLGEIHDNPDHHRLQAWVLAEILGRGRHPVVVMEMLDDTQAAGIAKHRAAGADAASFGEAVGWGETGWPAWETYRPVAEAAFAGGVELAWGNVPRKTARRAGFEGLQIMGTPWLEEAHLATPLAPDLAAALHQDIQDGHCGMLPAEMLAPLAGVQRLRDARMAARMAKLGKVPGAVLIAGGGHVRRDRAVPWYLARHLPWMPYRTLTLVEVEAGKLAAADYLPTFPDGRPATDFLWFTPGATRPDPCEKFAAHMKKKAAKGN